MGDRPVDGTRNEGAVRFTGFDRPVGISRSIPPSPNATPKAPVAGGRNATDIIVPTVGGQADGTAGRPAARVRQDCPTYFMTDSSSRV